MPPATTLASSLLFLISLTASCTAASTDSGLLVAAAASLTNPFTDLGRGFTNSTGIPVVFSFSSTGNLAQQIRNGAPFDVFASADATHIDQLVAEGYLQPGSPIEFARGRLVLMVANEAELSVRSISELKQPEITRIVIANPEHAPYGLAAYQALQRAGLWEELHPRIIYAETVHQAAQFVMTGNAPTGLVARSAAVDGRQAMFDVSPELYDPIRHVAAVILSSPNSFEASAFLEYLASPEAQPLLDQHGLAPAHASAR